MPDPYAGATSKDNRHPVYAHDLESDNQKLEGRGNGIKQPKKETTAIDIAGKLTGALARGYCTNMGSSGRNIETGCKPFNQKGEEKMIKWYSDGNREPGELYLHFSEKEGTLSILDHEGHRRAILLKLDLAASSFTHAGITLFEGVENSLAAGAGILTDANGKICVTGEKSVKLEPKWWDKQDDEIKKSNERYLVCDPALNEIYVCDGYEDKLYTLVDFDGPEIQLMPYLDEFDARELGIHRDGNYIKVIKYK